MPDAVARPKRGSSRPLILLTALALVSTLLVIGGSQIASAAPCKKLYTSTASANPTDPSSWPAGSSGTFTLNFKNVSTNCTSVAIGSIRISIPAGWTVTGVNFTGKNWVTVSSLPATGTLDIKASSGTEKVGLNQTLGVNITATAPCTVGTFSWNSTVWVATDFTSSQFTLSGPAPAVTTAAASFATTLIIDAVNESGTTDSLPMTFTDPPTFFAAEGELFDVVVKTDAPVCTDTVVTLTEDGSGILTQSSPDNTIDAGTSGPVTITASFAPAESGVTVTATSSPSLTPDRFVLNIALAAASATCTGACSLQAGGTTPPAATALAATAESTTGGEGTCDTDAANPTCAFITLPDGTGNTEAFLFLLECEGFVDQTGQTCDGQQVVTFTGNAGVLNGIYNQFNFYTFTVECDRTVCRGGGVTQKVSFFDMTNTGTMFVESPACTSSVNDAVDPFDPDHPFCTDYNASHRDNAQDLILVHRLAGDPSRK